VESDEGLSVGEIFERHGEAYFRELEGEVFRRLCREEQQIIGCGGGTLIDPQNQAMLRTRCCAVWLWASAGEIIRRIEQPGAPVRPLVKGEDLRVVIPRLLEKREGLYRIADLVVDTDGKSLDSIALEICRRLGLTGRAS
jgi:shikimate kinase